MKLLTEIKHGCFFGNGEARRSCAAKRLNDLNGCLFPKGFDELMQRLFIDCVRAVQLLEIARSSSESKVGRPRLRSASITSSRSPALGAKCSRRWYPSDRGRHSRNRPSRPLPPGAEERPTPARFRQARSDPDCLRRRAPALL